MNFPRLTVYLSDCIFITSEITGVYGVIECN